MNIAKAFQDLVVCDRLRRESFGRIVVAGDGEVEHFPSRERDNAPGGTSLRPQGCRVPAQIFRHLFGRNHRAIVVWPATRARRRRPSAAGFFERKPSAPIRAEPVMRSPVFNRTVNRAAGLVVTGHVAVGAQRDRLVVLTRANQDSVQLAAVNDRVGIPEAGPEIRGQIDVRDLFRGDRVHQPQLIDEDRDGADGIAELQAIEGVERVRTELNAGANFLIVGGPFKNGDLKSMSRERECCRQTAECRRRQ